MNMRLILLSLLSCATTVYATPWDDLIQAAQVAYTAPLNGEYVRQTQTGIEAFDIYRLRNDDTLAERRVAKNGKVYEIVRERDKISFYAARAEDLQYADTDESNRFPAILPFHAGILSDSYQATYQGNGHIAGRSCHIVRLTPYDNNRYTQELCLDDTDNLPLSRTYIHNNTIVRADLFATLDRENLPKAEELAPSRLLNYTFTRTYDANFTRLGENDTLIQTLPTGFHIAGYEQNAQGGYYLITDGLVYITLFIGFANENPQTQRNIPKNGVIATATLQGKKHHLTAMGDLSQNGLQRWLNSIILLD